MTHNLKYCFLLLIALVLRTPSPSQSLTGMTGLLNAPSADFQDDGTFFFGASYLDKSYTRLWDDQHNLIAYYGNITIVPFIEIGFRSTGPLDSTRPFNVDRMPSMRVRILKEGKWVPSLVIGSHDLLTSGTMGNQYFPANYLAISKHLAIKGFQCGLHAGYGLKLYDRNQFAGPFGGITLSHDKLRWLTLAGEYDGQDINLGAKVMILEHLQLLAVWQGMQAFSAAVVYKIYLKAKG